MTLDELLALLPDNTTGEISPADIRAVVTNLFIEPTHAADASSAGPYNLFATPIFTVLPGSTATPLVLDRGPVPVLLTLSAYLDSGVNSNDVSLALDLSGATLAPAGGKPEQTLRVGGKQFVAATVSISYLQTFEIGTTNVTVRYKASVNGGSVENVALTMIVLVG
jgi:hypothetical protein